MENTHRAMTIGQVARLTSVNVQTVRYYERVQLIPPPARTAAGYRIFDGNSVKRIRFVKHAQQLGFSLKQIRELLLLSVSVASQCGDVRKNAMRKVGEIDGKIDSLNKMKHSLETLILACSTGGLSGECPILDALEDEGFSLDY